MQQVVDILGSRRQKDAVFQDAPRPLEVCELFTRNHGMDLTLHLDAFMELHLQIFQSRHEPQ